MNATLGGQNIRNVFCPTAQTPWRQNLPQVAALGRTRLETYIYQTGDSQCFDGNVQIRVCIPALSEQLQSRSTPKCFAERKTVDEDIILCSKTNKTISLSGRPEKKNKCFFWWSLHRLFPSISPSLFHPSDTEVEIDESQKRLLN